jgi:hypothetical protein
MTEPTLTSWQCRPHFFSRVNSTAASLGTVQVLGSSCSVQVHDLYDPREYQILQIVQIAVFGILNLVMLVQIGRMIRAASTWHHLLNLPMFQLFVLWEINVFINLLNHADFTGFIFGPLAKTIFSCLQGPKTASGFLIVFKIWGQSLKAAGGVFFDDSGYIHIACQILNIICTIVSAIYYVSSSSIVQAISFFAFGALVALLSIINLVLEFKVVLADRKIRKIAGIKSPCSLSNPFVQLTISALLASIITFFLFIQQVASGISTLTSPITFFTAKQVTDAHTLVWMYYFVSTSVITIIILISFRRISLALRRK